MQCTHCQQSLPAGAPICPACGRASSIAASPGALERESGVRGAIDRIKTESFLARHDASAQLTRDLAQQAASPLTLADIEHALAPAEETPLDLLKGLLSADAGAGLLDGVRLDDLFREGVNAREILKTGVNLLKHRRYAEAVEWWSLNRQSLDRQDSGVHLLLLVMEMLSFSLAGNVQRAAQLRAQVAEHPSFRRLSRGS